jgi:hypothetical protein
MLKDEIKKKANKNLSKEKNRKMDLKKKEGKKEFN